MNIEKEIKSSLDNIVFLELKKDINLGGKIIKADIPLPIKLNSLISGIKVEEFEENIKIDRINEAIIFLLGIENNFKYKNEYINILKTSLSDIGKYIMYLSSKAIEDKDLIEAYIYIKSYDLIIDYNEDLEFAKYNILESIFNENFDEIEEKDKEILLKSLIDGYESIISKNNGHSLSYYRLGYIYRSLSYYLKSKIYLEKFLLYSKEDYENLKDEVREDLKEIEDYANIEIANSYISYGKFSEAYEALQKVSDLYPEKDELYYLFSLCQYNLGLVEDAIESVNYSIKINPKVDQYYNHKAISYISLANNDKAISTYKEGIIENEDSFLLNYNLGILLLNLKMDGYKKYLKKSYQLNPREEILELIN